MGVDKNSFMYYTIGTKKKKGIDSNDQRGKEDL